MIFTSYSVKTGSARTLSFICIYTHQGKRAVREKYEREPRKNKTDQGFTNEFAHFLEVADVATKRVETQQLLSQSAQKIH